MNPIVRVALSVILLILLVSPVDLAPIRLDEIGYLVGLVLTARRDGWVRPEADAKAKADNLRRRKRRRSLSASPKPRADKKLWKTSSPEISDKGSRPS